jgi:alkylation response protein AidB-like acyl-CoA dehydrogenase
MDFALSAEQRQFAAALHELLADSGSVAAARRWADGDREPGLKIWRSLAEAGVTGLMVPADCGGAGAHPVDLVIACEELGHHAVPGPVAESLAAVPQLLQRAGRERAAAAAGWLRQLAAGELIATMAAPPWLPYAADAETAGLVLLAEPDGIWVGEAGRSRRSVDATRSLSEVAPGQLLAEGPASAAAVGRALDFGAIGCAAQLLGAARALLELTVRHALHRVQFGAPVGSFQAVKHQLADVAIALEFARPLLYAAAIALARDDPGSPRDVSAAKVACAEAADRSARTALQVHGAIGYTAEHDAGLWLTKVRALVPAWGGQAEHRARVLASLTGAM